ncbi:hypothetical protein [Vibrio sp. DNB22_19_1]
MSNDLLVGIGGAGLNVVSFIKDNYACFTTLGLNTDFSANNEKYLDIKIDLSNEKPSETKSVDAIIKNYERNKEQVIDILNDYESIVFIVGLGGIVGTNIIFKLVELAQIMNKSITVFAIIPFNFEGKRRSLALDKLSTINVQSDVKVLVFDNQGLMENSRKMPITEAFETINKDILTKIK